MSSWLEGIAEAAQAQNEEDPGRAESAARTALLSRPKGAAATRARLALGLALRAEARFTEAAAVLAEVAPSADSAVRQYVLSALADALARAGQADKAAPIFSQVAAEGEGPIAERSRWREAEAFLNMGQAHFAAQAYQELLDIHSQTPAEPAARLGLAAAYRLLGENDRAIDQYRKLWLEYPGNPEGSAAEQILQQWREAGGPIPQPTTEERLVRVERLLEQARALLVLKALDSLDAEAAPRAPLTRSRLLRALALLQLGRHVEAEATVLPLTKKITPDHRPTVELVLARAAARLGRTEEASQHYQNLASATHPQVPGLTSQQLRDLPDDAAYLSAWLYYDVGRYAEAEKALRRFTRAHPTSRRAEDARWFRAWSLYRGGRRVAAARAFAALERSHLREGALYWQARLATSRSRAASLYLAAFAASASRSSWYSLLASARLTALKRPVPSLPEPPPDPPLDEIPVTPPLTRAVSLFSLGLRAEALEELSSLALHPQGTASLLAQLAEFAGDPEIPFRLSREQLIPTLRARRWSHPRPFSDLLGAPGTGFGIDPLFLLAVMRRESGFQRNVRSNAGAEGLLQLLPSTAERLATLLGVPLDLAYRLDEPEVNIACGAYYLGLLSDRFQDPAVVLAAYNAGPTVAARWAQDRGGMPLDEWVESIPYRETRHYVRVVLADYALYRRLNGLPLPPLDPARPVHRAPPGISF